MRDHGQPGAMPSMQRGGLLGLCPGRKPVAVHGTRLRVDRQASPVTINDGAGGPTAGPSGPPPPTPAVSRRVGSRPLRSAPPRGGRSRYGSHLFRGTDPMALALAQALATPGHTRKTKLTGLTGLGIVPPRRSTEGLIQRQLVVAPSSCPRCEGRVLQPMCRGCGEPTRGYVVCRQCGLGEHFDRRCYCQMCGWDAYFVSE